MTKIDRPDLDVLAFAINALANERTVFGDTLQSDELDDNLNTDYFRGFGIVGVNDLPTKQDFAALGFTVSQLIAYLFQFGLAEWNTNQEFNDGSISLLNGDLYLSLSDANIGNDPEEDTVNWLKLYARQSGVSQIAVRNWFSSPASTDSTNWNDIAWSPDLELFVAVGSTGGTRVMTSPDGFVWTDGTISNGQWTGVIWVSALSLFVATSIGGPKIATSPDGFVWTDRATPSGNNWQKVAYAPSLALLADVANSGTNRVMTSPDGINWTDRTAAENNLWMDIAWSEELTLFAAVSADGVNRVMTSPDGINWTARAAAEANSWEGITWSKKLGLFVAVATTGTNRIMTSPDGINWTARAHAGDGTLRQVEWSEDLEVLVAVGDSGTRIQYSLNGIDWFGVEEPEANNWFGITWSPEFYMFVSVAESGSNRVMRST